MTPSLSVPTPSAAAIDFTHPSPAAGDLNVRWIHGSISPKHNTDPDIQVHAYNEHTIILRQNMAVHFEAPFMFLLFGNDRAILLDTGATREPEFFPLRETVDALIQDWLSRHPRSSYSLIVAHTHLHRDHFEGDSQFTDRPNTTVVGRSLQDTINFYSFQNWPEEQVTFDLGGRVLQVFATPGHEEAEVCIYDRYTHLLFTGDIFYPGRLYITDWEAFVASVERMIAFTEAHPISHILGCHIEMSIFPGKDYLIRTVYHPQEPPLQMTVEQLKSLRSAIATVNGKPGIYAFDHYIIYHTIPDRYFTFDSGNPDAAPGAVC